jgi:hypothetical protein
VHNPKLIAGIYMHFTQVWLKTGKNRQIFYSFFGGSFFPRNPLHAFNSDQIFLKYNPTGS